MKRHTSYIQSLFVIICSGTCMGCKLYCSEGNYCLICGIDMPVHLIPVQSQRRLLCLPRNLYVIIQNILGYVLRIARKCPVLITAVAFLFSIHVHATKNMHKCPCLGDSTYTTNINFPMEIFTVNNIMYVFLDRFLQNDFSLA